jgi:hypothetical protein
MVGSGSQTDMATQASVARMSEATSGISQFLPPHIAFAHAGYLVLPFGLVDMVAPNDKFIEPDQSDSTCPLLPSKIFPFPLPPNHLHLSRRPASSRGAFRDRHGRRARDAVDASGARDECTECGRRSRVVLIPRRWDQVGGRKFRRRRWQESPVTGEITKETVKTIARGMPGVSGVTVVT